MKTSKLPALLLCLYCVVLIWSAINPVDRGVWVTEAITSAVPVVLLVIVYFRKVRLSNAAYVLMTIFPVMHAIGAHYTFALVPFGWFDHLFGFTRDMYDRVAHFSVGLYAFGIAEIAYVYGYARTRALAWSYALFAIMALAAAYEIFEWLYAVSSDPNAGIAILGSQGDIWDAQKDMLMDTFGGMLGVILFMIARPKRTV